MAGIQVLEKQVSELIAAGEVIERPASVVKELLENAMDAGADSVTLEIRRGGKSMIRLTDNGAGIAPSDVARAFLRHATSKIVSEEDLNHIETLGFRGEALASICAVSKVEVTTKRAKDPIGVCYSIAGGENGSLEEIGCANGSTFVVRDLFYNVPARLKFLKKDVTEGNAIAGIVEKLALSHPGISFRFIREGKTTLQTPGTNDLYATIHAVFGSAFAKDLMSVSQQTDGIKAEGYISLPMHTRSNRTMQHFFVNGRYVKSNTCVSALEEAYKGSIMVGKFPACVLFLTLPCDSFDSNVHPAKIEIRFADENAVLRTVFMAVKDAISNYNKRVVTNPDVKPHVEREAFLPEKNTWQTAMPLSGDVLCDGGANHFSYHSSSRQAGDVSDLPYLKSSAFAQGKEALKKRPSLQIIPEEKAQPVKQKEKSQMPYAPIRMIGELFETYILAQIEDQFILVDKHAAHERIIYNDLRKSEVALERQLLLAPITITLSAAEFETASTHLDDFEQFGILAEVFGDNAVVVRECPALLSKQDCQDIFFEVLENMRKNKQDFSPQSLDAFYHSVACKAAVKAHDENNTEELCCLLERVYRDEQIRFCPHGRPVILTYSRSQLEKKFGR